VSTPKVKSAQESARKWKERAQSASTEYQTEAANAGADWEARTLAASGNYKAAVTAGNIEKAYSSGVRGAGASKYQRGIQAKGDRYSGGIEAGEQDFQANVDEYLQVIASTDIGTRRPRGDSANQKRSVLIQEALHKRKLAKQGAGA